MKKEDRSIEVPPGYRDPACAAAAENIYIGPLLGNLLFFYKNNILDLQITKGALLKISICCFFSCLRVPLPLG